MTNTDEVQAREGINEENEHSKKKVLKKKMKNDILKTVIKNLKKKIKLAIMHKKTGR